MGLIAVQKYPIKVIRDFSSEGKSCIGDFSEEVFRKIDESLIPICDDKYLYWENGDNKHGCLMEKTDQEKIAQDLSKLMDAKVEKAKEITEVSLRSPLNLFLSIGIDTSNIL